MRVGWRRHATRRRRGRDDDGNGGCDDPDDGDRHTATRTSRASARHPPATTRTDRSSLARAPTTKRLLPQQGTPRRATRQRHDDEPTRPQTVDLDARPTTTVLTDDADATITDAPTRRRLFGAAERDANPTGKRRRTSSNDLARTPGDGGAHHAATTTALRRALQPTPSAHDRRCAPRHDAAKVATAPPPTTHIITTGTPLRHTPTTTHAHQPPNRDATHAPHPNHIHDAHWHRRSTAPTLHPHYAHTHGATPSPPALRRTRSKGVSSPQWGSAAAMSHAQHP